MFRHYATDQGKYVPEIERIQLPWHPGRGCRELEHNHAFAGFEHPSDLSQSSVEVSEVPHTEANDAAVEVRIGKTQLRSVGCDGAFGWVLLPTSREHRGHEIGGNNVPLEAATLYEFPTEVAGARAQVEVSTLQGFLPTQAVDGESAPTFVHV
jgi:hypothetical protein